MSVFNIANLQDNYLGTYVRMSKIMTDSPMAALLTYFCPGTFAPCVLFREQATDPAMHNIASVILCRSLVFVQVTSAPWGLHNVLMGKL